MIEVRLYTRLGDLSKKTSLTIPAYRGVFEKQIKILMPRGATECEAEITLRAASGKKLETGRFKHQISNEGSSYLLIDPYVSTPVHSTRDS